MPPVCPCSNDSSIAAPDTLLRTQKLPLDSGGEKTPTNHPDRGSAKVRHGRRRFAMLTGESGVLDRQDDDDAYKSDCKGERAARNILLVSKYAGTVSKASEKAFGSPRF